MTERLLQFIWQMQYFNKTDLHTVSGDRLSISYPGQFNTNQGPDFLEAVISIANTKWAGNIELHVKASDWKVHGHDNDQNYGNIILHVVWEHDEDIYDAKGKTIPALSLNDKVPKVLLQRYEELIYTQKIIPCENSLLSVPAIIWDSWKTRLVTERMQSKTEAVAGFLAQTNAHWEEVFWWLIARNFGNPVNSNAFEAIARSIAVNILAKHKGQIHQLESFLLGQAGLLNSNFRESYPKMLQKEFRFYKKKYNFTPVYEPVHFLRMRPGNFPTIRLAQLAMLINNSLHLFSQVKAAASVKEVVKLLQVTANDYWHYHYKFDDITSYKEKTLGRQMIDNILINTVIPIVFAYGHIHKEQVYKNKALKWLEDISPENNHITRQWKQLNIQNITAADSQSLIQLTKKYCLQKKCLSCAIGVAILKRTL
ncbi:DUF2851 domain-containing protein [Terrimonas sp.]|uniref:DUF2851 family protein n=1 Tax=Terrimonas sp. TaxID=1914338 RepID=UPI000D512A9A|nr:DUF2851 family protein [Terrimonas sp.]PVD50368.1 DUF2851 domain-containing protein [Terrimonas sp.]